MIKPLRDSRQALAGLILICACFFIIWQHSHYFMDIYCSRDVAGYAYNTLEAMQGRGWYASNWHSKPPGSSFIYMAAFYLFGKSFIAIRIAALLANLASVFLLYFLARLLLKEGVKLAYLLPLLYALFPVAIDPGGHGINLESLIGPFEIACILLLAAADSRKNRSLFYFISGLAIGLAFMIKQAALITFFAAILYILVIQAADREKISLFMSKFSSFLFAALVPVLFLSLFFLSKGVLPKFIEYSFILPVRHGSDMLFSQQIFAVYKKTLINLWPEAVILGLPALIGLIYMLKKRSKVMIILAIWALACLAALSFSLYSHYLIQLIAPLACLACVGLSRIYQALRSRQAKTAFFLLLAAPYLHTAYYIDQNKTAMSTPLGEIRERFLVSEYLKSRTAKSDKIFVWDDLDACAIYFWTGLGNASYFRDKYSFLPLELMRLEKKAFSGDYKSNQKRLILDLNKEKPKYIIVVTDKEFGLDKEEAAFPDFFLFLHKAYTLEARKGICAIYRVNK